MVHLPCRWGAATPKLGVSGICVRDAPEGRGTPARVGALAYDVGAVRGQYPALADGRAWLDGAAGTQVPQAVVDAVAEAY